MWTANNSGPFCPRSMPGTAPCVATNAPHGASAASTAAFTPGATGKTWVVWIGCRSRLHWTHTRKRLDFCTATQDGVDAGCLRLHHLSTAEQAEVIRDVLGIRKRVELTPETLERLRARTAT